MNISLKIATITILTATMLHGGTGNPSVPVWQLARLQKISMPERQAEEDMIIGQTDPDEIRTITGPYRHDGDITVLGSGQLILDHADFELNGDILILGNGGIVVRGGSFTVIQAFIYEHDAVVAGQGELRFENMKFRSSGQSWSIGVTNEARYAMTGSEVSDGFITLAFLEAASGTVRDCIWPGEFLCFDRSSLDISRSENLLMWLVLPELSAADMTLPRDSLVTDWHFKAGIHGVQGIACDVSVDSCTGMMWGLISESGSDAVFRDTDFRTIGLMFRNPDSIAVSGVTNLSEHADERIRIGDRDLRLVNSTVQTWSFYPSARSVVHIGNSVFGEVLAMDTSRVWIDNSVCDGSGGYMGVSQNGFLVILNSLVRSQMIARDSGVLVAAMSAVTGTDIDADDSAIMFLANTSWFSAPEAHRSAVIFEAWMPQFYGRAGQIIPIQGTARVLHGPDNPVELTKYEIRYNYEGQNKWISVQDMNPHPVFRGTLAEWDTRGLEGGNYLLELTLYHSLGDSISMNSSARLDNFTLTQENPVPGRFSMGRNYPNPFNDATVIPVTLQERSYMTCDLFDIRGRYLRTFHRGFLDAGGHQVPIDARDLPSGTYYYIIHAGPESYTGRCQLIR
ncbi:T9SS type A sorting domain-containing protein [bacterium]|nr:T9SS type A sorting domain-containing protein [bacterium]